MTHVWHLVRHAVRAHRAILLAWLAVLVVHPLFALVPWSTQADNGLAFGVAVLLVGARIVLGVMAIAAIVQADNPIDDRAFWRTRPIRPVTMAAAHLVTVVALLVVVPAVAVVVIGAVLGVPAHAWPSVATQVVVVELAFAGLSLVVATRTRSPATFLIWLVVVIGVASIVPFAAESLGRAALGPAQPRRPRVDPSVAIAATAMLGALVLPAVFVLAMGGPRRQRLLVVASLATLTASTWLWLRPQAQSSLHRQADRTLSAQPPSVRVVDVPGSPGMLALVLVLVPEVGNPGDSWRVTVKAGQLTTAEGRRPLSGARGVPLPPRVDAGSVAAVLTVLGVEEHRKLVGTRLAVTADVEGFLARHTTERSAPLATGAAIATDHSRLTVTDVQVHGMNDGGLPYLALQGMELVLQSAPLEKHAHQYVLRDRETGCEATMYPSWSEGRRSVMGAALLPTLSRPFAVAQVALVARQAPRCEFAAARADVDMRAFDVLEVPHASFSLDFTMPAASKAFPSNRAQGQRRLQGASGVREATAHLARLAAATSLRGAGRE